MEIDGHCWSFPTYNNWTLQEAQHKNHIDNNNYNTIKPTNISNTHNNTAASKQQWRGENDIIPLHYNNTNNNNDTNTTTNNNNITKQQ